MTDVLIHLEDAVLTFTLNREHKKNAFTQAMYTELADALRAAQDNPAVRVVIVQGHETFFSAGNDIADFLQAEGFGLDSPVIDFLQTRNNLALAFRTKDWRRETAFDMPHFLRRFSALCQQI